MVSIRNRLLEPILIVGYKYLCIYLTYSFLTFKKCRFGANFKVENNFLISLRWGQLVVWNTMYMKMVLQYCS